jgi:hypothetical protein
MTALIFETQKCADSLIEAGVPPRQAKRHAEIMADTFIHYADKLVTKDYLDARFDAQWEKINGELRLIKWTLAVIVAATVLPAIQQLLG